MNDSHGLAADDPECCDAIKFARRFKLQNAQRCRKRGTIRTATGLVCRQHHTFGYTSWSQTVGAAAPADTRMDERMRAVVGGE